MERSTLLYSLFMIGFVTICIVLFKETMDAPYSWWWTAVPSLVGVIVVLLMLAVVSIYITRR